MLIDSNFFHVTDLGDLVNTFGEIRIVGKKREANSFLYYSFVNFLAFMLEAWSFVVCRKQPIPGNVFLRSCTILWYNAVKFLSHFLETLQNTYRFL